MNSTDLVRAVMADQLAATPPMILTATTTALSIFILTDAVLKKNQTSRSGEKIDAGLCFVTLSMPTYCDGISS